MDDDDSQGIIEEIDADGSGEISFDEFLNWVATQDEEYTEEQVEEKVGKIFASIDTDGSGKLSEAEPSSSSPVRSLSPAEALIESIPCCAAT